MSTGASDDRFLIVNADDFGISSGVNRGIIEAHERGIVTSASLMVRYPAARAAAEYAGGHPKLSVGLHFDISEWRYSDGEWQPFYVVVDADDQRAVQRELEAQLAAFARMMRRRPTHLDSHQHVHNSEPVRRVMLDAAARLEVPLRDCTPGVTYRGDFYGQTGRGEPYPEGIAAGQLQATFESLSPGWSELGCHPGYPEDLDSTYLTEREEEVRVLCRTELKALLRGLNVQLCSYEDYRRASAATTS